MTIADKHACAEHLADMRAQRRRDREIAELEAALSAKWEHGPKKGQASTGSAPVVSAKKKAQPLQPEIVSQHDRRQKPKQRCNDQPYGYSTRDVRLPGRSKKKRSSVQESGP